MGSVRTINLIKIELFSLRHLVWILSVGLFFIFSLIAPSLFSSGGIHFILYVSSCAVFLVLAQAILLISGNLDLSIAQIAGLSTILTSLIFFKWVPGLPGWLSIVIICAIGGTLGCVNGLFVGKLKLNPFLVTLATYFIYRWQRYYFINRVIMGSELPNAFLFAGKSKIFGIKISIFIMIGLSILLYFILSHTKLGNRIYAVGGNPSTAKRLGINVGNTVILIFALAGVLAGISGMLYAGYTNAVSPDIVDGYVFMSFAGAIIGGLSLSGGRGTISGATGGTLLIMIIDTGLMMLAINPYIRLTFRGVIILIAILIDRTRTSLIDRILLPK